MFRVLECFAPFIVLLNGALLLLEDFIESREKKEENKKADIREG